jgi:predicted ATP-grasp superfamily ATP-dependent carboligase
LSIVRSLGKSGLAIYSGAPTSSPTLCSFSRYERRSLFYPDPKIYPELFKAFIKKSSKKIGYTIVIPVGYSATVALSKAKNELDVKIPVSDYESLSIAASKEKTLLLAKELGIPTPNTRIISSSEVKIQDQKFPIVVKGVQESGFVKYANDEQSLKSHINAIYLQQKVYPIIQEYIPGDGYGFFGLFNLGKPRAIFMHRRVRMYPITGGQSTCAESVYDERLLRHGITLLKALNWHGVAMVEFKKDRRDGDFKLMEINPKFWGSLDLAIASGVDFPRLLYNMTAYGDIKPVFNYKLNVKFMWPFPDDFVRVIDKLTDAKSFIADFLNPKVYKNIDFWDPTPNLMQLADTIHVVRNKFLKLN